MGCFLLFFVQHFNLTLKVALINNIKCFFEKEKSN
jgi:hypothetical protein